MTMKKIYKNPETRVVLIATQQMLATSPNAILDPNQSVDAGSIESREMFLDGEY